MKKDNINNSDLLRLQQKYGNSDLVDQIQTTFLEKRNRSIKRGQKFAKLIRDKYQQRNMPYHHILEKARMYKKKYGLSEEEFHVFRRAYESYLEGNDMGEVLAPMTNMMKLLGNVESVHMQDGVRSFSGKDEHHMNEIMKMYQASRNLHSQIVLQCIKYHDIDFNAFVDSKFEAGRGYGKGDHIHPIIVAMFLPKIKVFENHFLMSNMAGIARARFQRQNQLDTKADYDLMYALITDPDDVVCSTDSTVDDLMKRANVQGNLWNCVLHMRNGTYYDQSFNDFITAIDMCRINKYDNPELIYGRNDAVIMKRLLSVFSFRPTIVATTTGLALNQNNSFMQSVRPSVTTIPMINLRLPPTISNTEEDSTLKLETGLSIEQTFVENAQFVNKQTQIIYSKGVIMFFVDRRSNYIKLPGSQSFNLGKLPKTISGAYERVNTSQVSYKSTMDVNGDIFQLRSVICQDVMRHPDYTDENRPYFIGIGSHCRVLEPKNNRWLVYAPNDIGINMEEHITSSNVAANGPEDAMHRRNNPIFESNNDREYIQRQGTLFIFHSDNDENASSIEYTY
jgi:hypothetical protein